MSQEEKIPMSQECTWEYLISFLNIDKEKECQKWNDASVKLITILS